MIDWPTIKDETRQAICRSIALDPTQVRWRDEAVASTFVNDPSIWLRTSMTRRHGIEEELLTFVAPNRNQSVVLRGQRRFTLQVRAESFEQDISSPNFAGNLIDAIAIRLMRSSTRAGVTSFAIEERLPTVFFSYKESGRQVSCYVMDMMCLTVDYDPDISDGAGGWINEAIINGSILDASINAVPVSLDVKGS